MEGVLEDGLLGWPGPAVATAVDLLDGNCLSGDLSPRISGAFVGLTARRCHESPTRTHLCPSNYPPQSGVEHRQRPSMLGGVRGTVSRVAHGESAVFRHRSSRPGTPRFLQGVADSNPVSPTEKPALTSGNAESEPVCISTCLAKRVVGHRIGRPSRPCPEASNRGCRSCWVGRHGARPASSKEFRDGHLADQLHGPHAGEATR